MVIMERPAWLVRRIPAGQELEATRQLLAHHELNTVCQSACCPNIGECFSAKTATFMILGTDCTRRCRFCAVGKGTPSPEDEREAVRLREAVQALKLEHVVITSVTRDDLPDGGAGAFVRCIEELRSHCPSVSVEVLIPDLQGHMDAIQQVIEARPDVLNHNIETVPRLYPTVRPEADYQRSLGLLAQGAKSLKVKVKSGLMVGLGETEAELFSTFQDLRDAGTHFLTVGQYLRPSADHLPVISYMTPEQFAYYERVALEIGFEQVAAGPFVRSSYQAARMLLPHKESIK